MQIERIDEDTFFEGLNGRITALAEEIEETAQKIQDKPDASTYHIDSFLRPLKVMRKLQKIRDKARAFQENEDEPVVYVRKTAEGEDPRFYYLPQSKFDRSRLRDIIQQLEQEQSADGEIGYIS